MEEPTINVGVLQGRKKVNGNFNGVFLVHNDRRLDGDFSARMETGLIILSDKAGNEIAREKKIRCAPVNGSTFTLFDVTIGIQFHWERKQEQTFQGDLILIPDDDETLVAANEIPLEDYLASVISSEMNAEAPLPFLKAHAIASRSWLIAALMNSKKVKDQMTSPPDPARMNDEIVRWYDRENHLLFDVCADDHCQRYQGITRLQSGNARKAVEETRGVFLTHTNEICDARYHKACGGLTDNYENTWADTVVPYLTSVADSAIPHHPIRTEDDAKRWILTMPESYCNTRDENLLRQILPSFDQETMDFYRWEVEYSRRELEDILREKLGMELGDLKNLTPIERGPSGRIIRLKIVGSKRTLIVGRELEIRRCLSRNHLYSSAFIVSVKRDSSGLPTRFILTGAGWGHGVGLCQIGAAVMASKGYSSEEILKHYFQGTELKKLY